MPFSLLVQTFRALHNPDMEQGLSWGLKKNFSRLNNNNKVISYFAVACNLITTAAHSNSSFWVTKTTAYTYLVKLSLLRGKYMLSPTTEHGKGRRPVPWEIRPCGQLSYSVRWDRRITAQQDKGKTHLDLYFMDARIGSYTKSYFRWRSATG